MATYTLGPLMSSRRALLKDGDTLGHFDASMPIEECQRIVTALNFVEQMAHGAPRNMWNQKKVARTIMDVAP